MFHLRSLLLFAVVAAASCRKPSPPPPKVILDAGLRTFLGISSLTMVPQLPENTRRYFPIAVMFADGKEVDRANLPLLSVSGPADVRSISPIELFWSRLPGQPPMAGMVQGLNRTDLTKNYPYWAKFASSGWRTLPPDEMLMLGDIRVSGILCGTDDSSQGGPNLYPTSEKIPTAGRYVVIIGIVYGPDMEKMETRFFRNRD